LYQYKDEHFEIEEQDDDDGLVMMNDEEIFKQMLTEFKIAI
jgi:hypothetical protein